MSRFNGCTMLPGLVHDNPRDGGPSGVSRAVTLAHLDLDLSDLLTSGHLLHQSLTLGSLDTALWESNGD